MNPDIAQIQANSGEKSGNRREDLLRAAVIRFVEDGVRGATMEEIARTAGAGKATLYRYFSNKDAVVDALLEQEAHRFARRLEEAIADETTAAGRLEVAFVTGVTFLVEHPVLARDLEEQPAVLLPRIVAIGGPLVRPTLDRFAELVEEGIEAGELRAVDPREAAEVLLRLILSYLTFPRMEVTVDDPDQLRGLARRVVVGGLVPSSISEESTAPTQAE